MLYLPLIALACAFLANYAGRVFAGQVTDRMHLASGFSAGTVLAVAFFVFLPQAVLSSRAADGSGEALALVGLGFVVALLLDRFGLLWVAESGGRRTTGVHYAHGVLNGAAAGIAYHASSGLGALVAGALLAHEFSESAAVARELRGRRSDLRLPSRSALAFAGGLAVAISCSIAPALLGAALALLGGYFIYLSASDLIPESHHSHPQLLTVGMTFAGAGALYFANTLVGH